jgi:peptidoglycan DL-endopeptidase CwlO
LSKLNPIAPASRPGSRLDARTSLRRLEADLAESARDHENVIVPAQATGRNLRRRSNVLGVAVLAVIIPGLFATVALPAYAESNASPSAAAKSNAALQHRIHAGAQTMFVNAAATDAGSLTRDTITYIAPKPLAVVHPQFTGLVQSYGSISITGVAAIAAKYLGVPYVYGGESPAGFDCSGLVAYVYAQFGIRLPHSSRLQGEIGTPIARSAALPGDVVVMNGGSHVGIYIGGGRYIDAPYPGRVVSNDLIYDNDYYIVRFGIG